MYEEEKEEEEEEESTKYIVQHILTVHVTSDQYNCKIKTFLQVCNKTRNSNLLRALLKG